MIERTAKDALIRLASQFSVIGVTGPRQSGKSTLTQATFPDKRYVTFDDKNMRELAASNPSDFIMAFPNGAIIDEAQKYLRCLSCQETCGRKTLQRRHFPCRQEARSPHLRSPEIREGLLTACLTAVLFGA